MTLTTDQLDQYKSALLEERSRILSNIQSLNEELGSAFNEESTENGQQTHLGDVATVTFLRERDLSIEEHEEHLLNEIDTALERVRMGTYGLCTSCGKPIPAERLEALPWASRCMDCEGANGN